MSAQCELNIGHPMRDAWEAYKASEGYANTRYWARVEDHTEGSLWAAFIAGYAAAQKLATLPEDAGMVAKADCVPDDSYEAAQAERRELWKQRVDELVGELSKNLRQAFADASAAPATGQEG